MTVCARFCGVTWVVGEDFYDLVLRSEDVSDGCVGDLVEGEQVVFGGFVLGRYFYQVPTVVVRIECRHCLPWFF